MTPLCCGHCGHLAENGGTGLHQMQLDCTHTHFTAANSPWHNTKLHTVVVQTLSYMLHAQCLQLQATAIFAVLPWIEACKTILDSSR